MKVPKKNHAHEVAVGVKSGSVKRGDLTLIQPKPVKVPKKNLASGPEVAPQMQSARGKGGDLTIITSKPVEIPKKKPALAARGAAGTAVEGGDLSVSEPTIAERAIECQARRLFFINFFVIFYFPLHQLLLVIFR